jgi:antitoxin CcdA
MRKNDAHTIYASTSKRSAMLKFENSAKKAANLSLNASVLAAAKDLGMNISQTVDELLEKEVRRLRHIQWVERNQAAIEHYNARIESEGTFAQQVQEWLIEQGESPAPRDARAAT